MESLAAKIMAKSIVARPNLPNLMPKEKKPSMNRRITSKPEEEVKKFSSEQLKVISEQLQEYVKPDSPFLAGQPNYIEVDSPPIIRVISSQKSNNHSPAVSQQNNFRPPSHSHTSRQQSGSFVFQATSDQKNQGCCGSQQTCLLF